MNVITLADLDGLFTVPKGKRSARVTQSAGALHLDLYAGRNRVFRFNWSPDSADIIAKWCSGYNARIVRTG